MEARDQALAANRSKSTFLAHMSHELRTPLERDSWFFRHRAEGCQPVGSASQGPGNRCSSGEHLLGLIDDVLDMAKIETGGTAVESACIDLHTLIERHVNHAARACPVRKIWNCSSKGLHELPSLFVRTQVNSARC